MNLKSPARQILLVEDEPSLVMTLSDLLASEGHRVRTISDGQEGFETACREGFELLILDVMLPHKNGFDICRGPAPARCANADPDAHRARASD